MDLMRKVRRRRRQPRRTAAAERIGRCNYSAVTDAKVDVKYRIRNVQLQKLTVSSIDGSPEI